MDNSTHPTTLDTMLLLPQEVILHIMSYLDFPELEIISVVSPLLSRLAYDPILSRNRILVVAASRVDHGLFGGVQLGDNFRPTIPDLIQRNVLRGLGLERRWRMGLYFYSSQSVKLYESSLRLEHARVIRVLSRHIMARAGRGQTRRPVATPVESESTLISRRLLPTIARLNWEMTRDRISRSIRSNYSRKGMVNDEKSLKRWMEINGMFIQETERVRLAICPGVRKFVRMFDKLTITQ